MDADRQHHGGPAGSVFVLHEKNVSLEPHGVVSHTEHGLTYLVDGSLRMEQGRTVSVEAGTITVVPAGIPHRAVGGEGVEYWLLGFCSSCLRLDEGQRLMSPFRRVRHGALPVVPMPKSRRAHLLRLFRELHRECEHDTPESPELRRSLVLLLLGEVLRAMSSTPANAPEGSLVSDALEYIQRHCLERISLRDVAAAVYRSPAHVAATVKKSSGHSVGEWIAAGRVSEAAVRLSHTDDPLDKVAADVGWRDKTHFIRQFRKAYGITPAAWRREQRVRHESSSVSTPTAPSKTRA